jgi:hypothetical protein
MSEQQHRQHTTSNAGQTRGHVPKTMQQKQLSNKQRKRLRREQEQRQQQQQDQQKHYKAQQPALRLDRHWLRAIASEQHRSPQPLEEEPKDGEMEDSMAKGNEQQQQSAAIGGGSNDVTANKGDSSLALKQATVDGATTPTNSPPRRKRFDDAGVAPEEEVDNDDGDEDDDDESESEESNDCDWDEVDVANELEMLYDLLEGLLESGPPNDVGTKSQAADGTSEGERTHRKRLFKTIKKIQAMIDMCRYFIDASSELREQEVRAKEIVSRAKSVLARQKSLARSAQSRPRAIKAARNVAMDAVHDENAMELSSETESVDRAEPTSPAGSTTSRPRTHMVWSATRNVWHAIPESEIASYREAVESSTGRRPAFARSAEMEARYGIDSTSDSGSLDGSSPRQEEPPPQPSTEAVIDPEDAANIAGSAALDIVHIEAPPSEVLGGEEHSQELPQTQPSTEGAVPPTNNAGVKTKVTKAALERAKATKAKLAVKMKLLNALRKQKIMEKARPTTTAPTEASLHSADGQLTFTGKRLPNLSALRTPLSIVNIDAHSEPGRVHFATVIGGNDDDPTENQEKEGKPAVEDVERLEVLLSSPLPTPLCDLTIDNQHPQDEGRPTQAVTKLSREELLRRHKEAERKKAITLCRNVIAKHEALEAEQSMKLKETKTALEEAQSELDANSKEISDTQQSIATLRLRKQAVESLMSEYVAKLVDARRALHEHRTQLGEQVDIA